MKKLYLIFLVGLYLPLTTFAQFNFSSNNREQDFFGGQSIDAFEVNLDSLMLDSIIVAYKNSESIPGIATMIVKDNQVIWNNNYGYRNLQSQLPVEDSTFFQIGSISKTFVATAIMQLWQQGMIDLENNINNYLPSGFTVSNYYYPNDTITVKMLMIHTSSLQENWGVLSPLVTCGDSPIRLDSFLVNYFTPGGSYYDSLSNFYNYHPGQNYNYTNVGYGLLALMVENLTGKSFDEYCRDSIFIPLSMTSSSWFLDGMDLNQIATPYEGSNPVCHQGFPNWPAGFLRTNKLEILNYLLAYLNFGIYNNVRILDSATVAYMLSDQLGYPAVMQPPWVIYTQGLSWWQVFPVNSSAWARGGSWNGILAYVSFDQEEKWVTIFFQNQRPLNTIVGRIGEINYPFTKYADLYGNIYAFKPEVDKGYARVGTDNVLFRTTFSNRYNHQFNANLIYANSDSTILDSLELFDDGVHGDSLSNDGIYGNYIPPQQTENFYYLGVSTIDNQTNKYFNTPDICRFTTVGPVTLDSVFVLEGTYNFSVTPFLKNHSTDSTITNVSVRLICNDPWIISITPTTRNLPNILPGAIISPTAPFTVTVDTVTFPNYFNFEVEVTSNGWPYWTDSMRVPPIAIISINPTELDFGEVAIDSSATKTFTITNFGDEDLVVSNITSSDPVFVVDTTNIVIPPDSSQDVEVTFTPTGALSFNGKIEITHNAAGSPDSVIVTGDGVTGVGEALLNTIPTVFVVYQNYPNPFNPSTSIKFGIPEVSKVKLILFNLLGEEVATLVNEEKTAGYYTVEFNEAYLPSGIYFYRIQAGSFVETKKMLLLK